MLVFKEKEVRELAPLPQLIEALRVAFRNDHLVPARQMVALPGAAAEHLFAAMPVFDNDGVGAVKLATFHSDNQAHGLPTIQAAIVVLSSRGTPVAIMDGGSITHLRTGAASALASSYLSRRDSAHLLLIGTGALAPTMAAAAHCAVRPITRISVWGRRAEQIDKTVAAIRTLVGDAVNIVTAQSVELEARAADIVSCATSSTTPVLAGKWLKPGTFVDLVGSFSPRKREADDEVVLASRIFVDTMYGALSEAGDLVDPLARGVISRNRIEGELADLVCGRIQGRTSDEEITLYKSVGTAIEDLAAARLVVTSAAADVLN